MEKRTTIRTSEESLHAWKVAAAIRGVSLNEWVNQVLTATAKATVKVEA